jgi:hypothetical protein
LIVFHLHYCSTPTCITRHASLLKLLYSFLQGQPTGTAVVRLTALAGNR